ncbi:RluA family pseudouridine synthase [Sulfobacillus thermosulfidooxidans]|uniref:RluA family pseudouridine synthase n=1 Tax=Sulfobacillus thermosulfidooxidans TaxID=28034 RepID=UPI0006B62A3B|nr:RluA family pseudouridine synthase [Sulfobacillus thermosulfidooxidans]
MASLHPKTPTSFQVSSDMVGKRLDRVIYEWNPEHSRTFWQRLIQQGHIRLNGRAVKSGTIVQTGDEITIDFIDLPAPLPPLIEGSVDTKWIVYQDDYLIVVNKPRQLVVHPSRGHENDSVVHRLLPLLPYQGEDFRPGVVHRLDRDTTGLLVLARSEDVKAKLSQMIQQRQVHRDYIAVIQGHMTPSHGIIDAPIGRHLRNRLKMAIVKNGREARTRYYTLATWGSQSLVQLSLDTGRTHQIRVHLSSMGHYVIGDPLYGPTSETGPGQLLHAMRLAFLHPVTQVPLCFWTYPPSDWKTMIQEDEPVDIISPSVFHASIPPCPDISTRQLLIEGLGLLI